MKLFVGIDVSSIDLKTCIIDPEGSVLKSFTVDNNFHGAGYLRDQIVDLADKHSCHNILIGMESTSVYSWHPAMFLNEDEALRKRQTKVYTINAKLINKFKGAYADLDKTDDIDAWVIADRLRFGRLPQTMVMQEQYVALQRLTMNVSALADYLSEKGKNRFPDPKQVAKCIQKAANSSYRLSKCIEDSIDVILGTSIETIRSLTAQIKA